MLLPLEKPLSVLLIEDNPADARLLRETLRDATVGAVDLDWITTLADAQQKIQTTSFDAILLDLSLPDSQGLNTLLAMCEIAADTPIIVLTGLSDQSMAIRALREGAQDYILKGSADAELLWRSIRYAVERNESQLILREAQNQLQQSQRMDTVGRLAGGVAHDFNNLLTVIEGYAKLLIDSSDTSAPARKDLTAIHTAAERAATLTRQLLAFSRRQVMRPDILDLNTIVGDMEKMLRRTLGAPITLVVRLNDGPTSVKADPAQLEQVLLNLAINARDAMPDGGQLIITCKDVVISPEEAKRRINMQPGHYVQLIVTDNGCGMSEQVKNQMFDPFFTTKPFGENTGLGLSTVYGIIKQSGGHIWADSQPRCGTSVTVSLPVVSVSQRRALDDINTDAHAGTECLLLVEDETELLALLDTYLTRLGYRILPAASAQEALAAMESSDGSVDMLICDVVLPDLNGPNLLTELRRQHPVLPVLFMSAYPGDSIIQRGVIRPGMPFISKPFTPPQLGRRIRDILDAVEPGEAATTQG
ncbi:MAG: response regulator [Verrucomicrobia bacterium]|nr:response regulator [Verrucomicrobiota bacterium]